jgi:glycosyltransferase involved in cell wall biosynthesis
VRVVYFGTWERGYPRNEQVISALQGAGVTVDQVHVDVWTAEHKFGVGVRAMPRLLAAELELRRVRLAPDVEALLVGYPGQPDMWAAVRHRRPVVFNAMLLLHDTLVEDRHRFREGSLAARALRQIDVRALRAAELVVADTAANAEFMAGWAGIDGLAVCYVGAEERLFTPAWRPREEFHALFVGKLIPLHGLDAILAAARLLPDVRFRVVGSGQLDRLLRDRPPNVEHVPWVEYERLPAEYAAAGCALGIFGSSAKAKRVIPNKAFHALAVGTPLVTADTEGARELLTDGRNALLVGRSPESIADAVRRIRDDPRLAEQLSREGRATFEREASESVLGNRWREAIEQAIVRRR